MRDIRLGRRLVLLAVALPALFPLSAAPASAEPVRTATPTPGSVECDGPCPIIVYKRGDGFGRVYSITPAGRIDCRTSCTMQDTILEDYEEMRLRAVPDPGYTFLGWDGFVGTTLQDGDRYVAPGAGLGGSVCARFARPGTTVVSCDVNEPPPPPAPPPPPPPPANVAPTTRITAAPRASTRSRRASFRFVSNERGVQFFCKLDRQQWLPCRSPKAYNRLRVGVHTFRVRALDRGGLWDRTPAARRWRVTR